MKADNRNSRTVALALIFVLLLISLTACVNKDNENLDTTVSERFCVKYSPVNDETSFSGYHWIEYATYHEDQRFGIFANTQNVNVTQQTFQPDNTGSMRISYYCPELYDSNMANAPRRTVYKKASLNLEEYCDLIFWGCDFTHEDSSLARAYVNWRVKFVGTDWEFYQPTFHVYTIYYTYIEKNDDDTLTLYRCDFQYRIHYDEDWLSEYAENKTLIPTYE